MFRGGNFVYGEAMQKNQLAALQFITVCTCTHKNYLLNVKVKCMQNLVGQSKPGIGQQTSVFLVYDVLFNIIIISELFKKV